MSSKRQDLSRDETEKFIQYFQGQESLWNLRHHFYSKREHRQAAQLMIAQQMSVHGREMTVDQVNSKIASLRTYYGKELRKLNASEKSGSSTSDVYKSPWEFFPLLDAFLQCHVQQRTSTCNLRTEVLPVPSTSGVDGCFEPGPDMETSTKDVRTVSTQDSACDGESAVSRHPKRKQPVADSLDTLMYKTLKNFETKKQECDYKDSDFYFGQQIGMEIRNISDPRKKHELKIKIQQLMFEYQFPNES